MCLRKTSTINVYIEVIYICYSVYRSRETLQIIVIEMNIVYNVLLTIYQRFYDDLLFINDFITIYYY